VVRRGNEVARAALFLGACVLSALAGVACVDDSNIPPRPSLTLAPDGGDDAGAGDDSGNQTGSADGGPITLAAVSPCENIKLAVSAGVLYWTEEATGTVKSVPTSGGHPTVIANGQGGPGAIAVDSKSVYWAASNRRVIQRWPLAGGSVTVFVRTSTDVEKFGDENQINALLVASGTLFFGRYTYTSRIPTDADISTMPMIIGNSPVSDLGRPGAYVLNGKYLYQVEIFHNAVTREVIDGTQDGLLEDVMTRQPYAPDRIAVSQGELLTDAIGMIDDHVVWANGPSIFRKVGSAAEGVAPTLVATTLGGSNVTGFVISNGFVYFGEGGADTVQVSAVYDGSVSVLATGQMSPGQFVADDENIYWRTTDCKIMKLAK
jgi:hypothetical protein